MKTFVVIACIFNTIVSGFCVYYVRKRLEPPTYQTELEKKAFSTYATFATQQYVIDEIQRASFCQNWVLTMVDEWKENKDKPNASIKEKLGPSLWERCSRYLMPPIIPKSKK